MTSTPEPAPDAVSPSPWERVRGVGASLVPFAFLAASTATFLRPGGDAPWVFLRLFVALIAIAVLPGYLALRVFGLSTEASDEDLYERVVYGFGLTLVAQCALFGLAFLLHVRTDTVAVALLLLCAALALLNLRRPAPAGASSRGESHLPLALGLLLVLTGALLYRIGGVPGAVPERAEALDIIVVRKIAESPGLALDQLYYKAGALVPFRPPFYEALLALVSRVSGLDPLVVFARVRFLWSLMALGALYAVLRQLAPSRETARIGAVFLLAMVLSGRAGGWSESFARLAPWSAHADVGRGLFFPLGLAFTVRFLSKPGRSRFFLAAPLVLSAIALLSASAGYLVTSYLLVYLAGSWLWRERSITARVVLLLAALVVAALLRAALLGGAPPPVVEWTNHLLTSTRESLERCDESPARCLFASPAVHAPSGAALGHGYFLLAFLVAPLMLAVDRRAALFVALPLLAALAVASSPLLAGALALATFCGEVLSPVDLVVPGSYLALALLGCALAIGANRLALAFEKRVHWGGMEVKAWLGEPDREEPDRVFFIPESRTIATTLSVALLATAALVMTGTAARLREFAFPHLGAFALAVLALSVLALLYRKRRGDRAGVVSETGRAFPSRNVALVYAGVVFAALALDVERPDGALALTGRSLFREYAHSRNRADVARFEDWYHATRYLDIPYPMLQYIRALPPGRTFAYTAPAIGRIPVLASQFVYTTGAFAPLEQGFVETYARLRGIALPPADPKGSRVPDLERLYRNQIVPQFPFYNDEDPPDQVIAWLRAFSIDYVIWKKRGGGEATRGNDIPDLLPASFEPEFQSGRFTLYRVKAREGGE